MGQCPSSLTKAVDAASGLTLQIDADTVYKSAKENRSRNPGSDTFRVDLRLTVTDSLGQTATGKPNTTATHKAVLEEIRPPTSTSPILTCSSRLSRPGPTDPSFPPAQGGSHCSSGELHD